MSKTLKDSLEEERESDEDEDEEDRERERARDIKDKSFYFLDASSVNLSFLSLHQKTRRKASMKN